MSTDDDRPQDGTPAPDPVDGPDRTQPAPPEDSGSVLGGFSWDDPEPSAGAPRTGAAAPGSGDGPTPAAYPPPAPYPPAGPAAGAGAGAPAAPGAPGPDPAADRPRVTLDKPSSPDPYAQPASPGSPAPGQPAGYGPTGPGYAPGYGAGYGGPVTPEQGPAAQAPYGQQVPYGQGYGQSAAYTSTPQPYAYGPPPLSPEAEKVRSSAVLWTVLNGVAIFLCGNLLSIGGVILAALAIGRSREDVPAARGLVKWSWILFAVGFAFWLLIIIGYVVFFIVLGTAGMSGGF